MGARSQAVAGNACPLVIDLAIRLFEHGQWIQTELKRSNEELRRVNRDLEVFAYSASHDLQEPLRTVAISAQLIQRSLGKRVSGDDATFLANIITAAKRMSVLIQDLLAYTRATKSFSTAVTDRARVAASDPMISSLSRERSESNRAIRLPQ